MYRFSLLITCITIQLFLYGCSSVKADLKTNAALETGYWRIERVIDDFYGEEYYYGGDLISVKGKPAEKSRELGQFDVIIKFGNDSTLTEQWQAPGMPHVLPKGTQDSLTPRWRIHESNLYVDYKSFKAAYHKIPVLHDQIRIMKCSEHTLVLKQSIDKTKWVRTFYLAKY
jgi:hypothetical protein